MADANPPKGSKPVAPPVPSSGGFYNWLLGRGSSARPAYGTTIYGNQNEAKELNKIGMASKTPKAPTPKRPPKTAAKTAKRLLKTFGK